MVAGFSTGLHPGWDWGKADGGTDGDGGGVGGDIEGEGADGAVP